MCRGEGGRCGGHSRVEMEFGWRENNHKLTTVLNVPDLAG